MGDNSTPASFVQGEYTPDETNQGQMVSSPAVIDQEHDPRPPRYGYDLALGEKDLIVQVPEHERYGDVSDALFGGSQDGLFMDPREQEAAEKEEVSSDDESGTLFSQSDCT